MSFCSNVVIENCISFFHERFESENVSYVLNGKGWFDDNSSDGGWKSSWFYIQGDGSLLLYWRIFFLPTVGQQWIVSAGWCRWSADGRQIVGRSLEDRE